MFSDSCSIQDEDLLALPLPTYRILH